jgi:arsenate reductase
MAEAFLNRLGEDGFEATSAGLEPTAINPEVVEVMREIGYDISGNEAKSVFNLYRQGRLYEYVITVCRESVESKCPIFPGIVKRLKWEFDDPAQVQGTPAERLAGVRKIRDLIKARVEEWLKETGRP